jgi:hypothetical protein
MSKIGTFIVAASLLSWVLFSAYFKEVVFGLVFGGGFTICGRWAIWAWVLILVYWLHP